MKDANLPNPPQRRKKRKKKVNYFGQKTQDAIVDFQNAVDSTTKKHIFVERIQPAFSKLIENLIFVYKFHSLGQIDALKNDCLSFLFETLDKYDVSKGSKAFSYFNVVARNWFRQQGKIITKSNQSNVSFDKDLLSKLEQSENSSIVISYEDEAIKQEFLELLREEVKQWRSKFDKAQEKKVLEAIILLLGDPDLVDIYNKKGIYLMVREITGLNTKQIVTNLAKLRKKYDLFKKRYYNGEV